MTRIKDLFKKYRELILYVFFGGCTTLVNIVAYFILTRVGIGEIVSNAAAWVLSVAFAYVTNRIFVFESKRRGFVGILVECTLFFAARLFTGVLDTLNIWIFVTKLHFYDMVVKIVSNIVVIVLNYLFSKILIFTKNKNKAED